jgi:hypothetical protein
VQIDSQGLRSRRNEEIEDLIQEIHQNVMSGRIFTTGYLQPRERRLIHVGLSELGGVKTISKGQGIRKKVVAMPLRRGRGGGHRRRGGFGYGQRQHQHEDVDGNVASEQSEV